MAPKCIPTAHRGYLLDIRPSPALKGYRFQAGKPAKLHVDFVDSWTALAEHSGDSAFDVRMVCKSVVALRLPPQSKIVLI
jgi:hypothetical protein